MVMNHYICIALLDTLCIVGGLSIAHLLVDFKRECGVDLICIVLWTELVLVLGKGRSSIATEVETRHKRALIN